MKNDVNKSNAKVYAFPIILMIIMWVILFLPAGTIKFWQAWILWIGFSLITIFIAVYFTKKSPEFLARRSKTKETVKTPAVFKIYFIGFILPGIDFRFAWSKEPTWLVILSNLIFFAAYIFIFFVFRENTYASTVIQVENKQKVITTGILLDSSPSNVFWHANNVSLYAAGAWILFFTNTYAFHNTYNCI